MHIKVSQKMISLEKWKILPPLQKLPSNDGDLGKIIVATGFKKLPKVQYIAQFDHTAPEWEGLRFKSHLPTTTWKDKMIFCIL